MRRDWDDEYEDEEPPPPLEPIHIAGDQICDAMSHIDRHPGTLVRWPFPDLDALTGPMGAGEVWFVCAFSGGGKTTFVASCVDLWRKAGKRMYIMPLELQPHRFRTYLACMEEGVHPGDALSGQLRADPSRDAERERLKTALLRQAHKGYLEYVTVSSQRGINVAGLEWGMREAKELGAEIVIVDHIDHIAAGGGQTGYEETKAVNHAALRMAQDYGLLLVCTSQLNNQLVAGGQDHLARYQPPREHHVLMGSKKREVATGMIGLYRPIRGKMPAEPEEQYLDAIRRARKGEAEPGTVLASNVMGVTAMKLRNYGQNEGRRVSLAFRHGRVLPLGLVA